MMINSDKFQIINDIVWAALETEGKGWKQIFKVRLSSLDFSSTQESSHPHFFLGLDVGRVPDQERL
jgi:hypothetical protein